MFEWNLTYFILATTIIALASLFQAATGLGAGFMVVPLLGLISLDLVPGPTVFASFVLTMTMTWRGQKDIRYQGLPVLFVGLFIGIVIAGLVISRLDLQILKLLFGLLIAFVVILSVLVPDFKLTKPRLMIAGAFSGFIGTVCGMGAPILALVYQHQKGAVIRATLALVFVLSGLMMLVSLHFAGRFGMNEVRSGLYLMPGFLIGYLASPKLAQFVDKGLARILVLSISSVSAIFLIFQALGSK